MSVHTEVEAALAAWREAERRHLVAGADDDEAIERVSRCRERYLALTDNRASDTTRSTSNVQYEPRREFSFGT